MDEERFTKAVAETVAKRAGNICSNPDCNALTSGPAEDADRSVSVGEAAHIYGARPGSARHVDAMVAAERGDSTNAIWLCRNCHKLVDSDPPQYPAELLFEWRHAHEQAIAVRLGKAGDLIRQRLAERKREEFSGCSYFAQQIILEKPNAWEFKLVIELMRTKFQPIVARWKALERGLYTRPNTIISRDMAFDWFQSRNTEFVRNVHAAKGIIVEEFARAWGPLGTPGSDIEIVRTCDLLAECAQSILDWEETIRFAHVPNAFAELQQAYTGIGGRTLDQLDVLPKEMAAVFANGDPQAGKYAITVVFDLPEDWVERTARAMERAADALLDG